MKNDGNNCIYRPLVIKLPMTVEKNIGVQIFMNNKKTIKKNICGFPASGAFIVRLRKAEQQ